jgi:hypothetical protein
LVLPQEFSDEDELVKNPLVKAVHPSVDFNKFKEKSWRGFEALWAAIRFRTFYKRFALFISPRDARICLFVMAILFIALLCVAQMMKTDSNQNANINGYIGAVAVAVNGLWWIIIEHGRILKKSVDKLQTKP